MFEHLVISGGGHSFFQMLGIFKQLFDGNIVDKKKLASIYSTSSGSIISILLSLPLEWSLITSYCLERPWQKIFKLDIEQLYCLFNKKGIYNITHITQALKPIFDCADISLDISLQDFFTLTNVEHHFFSFEVNSFVIKDINYKSYPDIKLLVALQMTCALPFIFEPVYKDDMCFIDGGITSNFPIEFCMTENPSKSILGIRNEYVKHATVNVTEKTNVFDFLLTFIFKLLSILRKPPYVSKSYTEIVSPCLPISIDLLQKSIHNMEFRKQLFKEGLECGASFVENHPKDASKN